MTRNEKRLIIGLVALGGFAVLGAVVVAGLVLATATGIVTFERDSLADEAPRPAVVVPTRQSAGDAARDVAREAAGIVEKARDAVAGDDGGGAQPARVLEQSTEELGDQLGALYEQVNPGVVSVLVTGAVAEIAGQQIPQMGAGSGWVYDRTHVVTNNHVAGDASEVEVVFADGERRKATVVGADVFSDLAVLEVEDMPSTARALPVMDDFDAVHVGEPVVAIGNPFNKSNSMSFGIVSALGRVIPDGATRFAIPQTIQTDAAINPGNSGGPLLDLRGRVLGVNAQINTTNFGIGGTPASSGVGFAIPASIVAKVVPSLIEGGTYAWPYLGVTGGSITVDVAEANDLENTKGAYISCVVPGGPSAGSIEGADNVRCDASGTGLTGGDVPRGGDVITAINGEEMRSFDDLLSYIALETRPGETVRLTVLRDGRTEEVEVELGSRTVSEE